MISFLSSQRYENGGIYVLYIAIQYFRLGYSDWLSSVFLRPPCILEIPRELLINLLAPPDPTLGYWACAQIPGEHLVDATWGALPQVTAKGCSLGTRDKAWEMEGWEGRNLTGIGGDRAQASGLSHIQLQANCFNSTLSL